MNKDILDLGKKTIGKTAKGIRTINRFIKLFNSMPEEVQQKFYRKMAAKIVSGKVIEEIEEEKRIKRIYNSIEKLFRARMYGTKEYTIELIGDLLKKGGQDYSGSKITHRPPERKPADFYDKKL